MKNKVMYVVAIAVVVICGIVLSVALSKSATDLNITQVKIIDDSGNIATTNVTTSTNSDGEVTVIEPLLPVEPTTNPDKTEVTEKPSIIVDAPERHTTDETSNTTGDIQKIYSDGEIVNVIGVDQPVHSTPTPKTAEELAAEKVIADRNKDNIKLGSLGVTTSTGDAFKLSDIQGKSVIAICWSTDVEDSVNKLSLFQKIYDDNKDQITFLFINRAQGNETNEVVEKFMQDKGYTFPVVYDYSLQFMSYHEVYSLPAVFYINTDGYIVTKQLNGFNEDTINKFIGKIR